MKFKSISYGVGMIGEWVNDRHKKRYAQQVTMSLGDGKHIVQVSLTRKDMETILKTIVAAYGVRLGAKR
jgi:hypothetical protein